MNYIKLFESWSDDYILDFTDAGFDVKEVGDKLVGEYKGKFNITDITIWYGDLVDRLEDKYKVISSNLYFSKRTKTVSFEISVDIRYGPVVINVKEKKNESTEGALKRKLKKYLIKEDPGKMINIYPHIIYGMEHHIVRLNTTNAELYKARTLNNSKLVIICKNEDNSFSYLYICESDVRPLQIGPSQENVQGLGIFYDDNKLASITRKEFENLFNILPKLGKKDGNKTIGLEPSDINKILTIKDDCIKFLK